MKEIKMSDTRRRVKLYMLNNSRQWDDRGTGHVLAEFSESAKCVTLQVRAESDGTILLNSSIQSDTAYQKQQETLIVWSETEHSDLALSFQEKAGCDEIWEKICEVQGKDPSVDITQEVPEDSEDDDDDLSNSRIDDGMDGLPHQSTSPYALPQCVLSELDDISECFTFSMRSPVTREQLARSLEENNYIPQLIELFRRCEDLEDRDSLHKLYEIVKIIFLLNKSGVFDVLIQEEHIMSVIGCLEYDPALSEPRRHRSYLNSGVSFKEVLPISNVELRKKIHQTFRLQYIQDVVLPTPSVFEENMLSTLASVIFFNKVEIVSMVQDDPNLLPNLFKELSDDQVTDHRRRELAGFLRELCLLSQTLQPSPKDDFFKYLLNLGLLPGIEQLFACDDHQSHRLAIDIFQHVVEHSPSMVRDFANQEMTRGCSSGSSGADNNNTSTASNSTEQEDFFLLNMVIEQMICDPDPELSGAMQLNGLLRILLDPENMLAKNNEKTEFLGFFYRHCMHVLMAPVLANTADDGGPSKDDYQTAHILSLILDLVTFSVEHHTYHVKNYIMSKDLLRRVLVLLKSNHKFLGLSALRFMRKIVGKLDEVYNRYIIKGDLMKPVVNELFVSGKRYNLINSAILEMFEFINTEKVRSLTHHIVSQHYKRLQEIDYVQTFTKLKITFDQQQERIKILHDTSSTSTASTVSMNNSMSHNHRFGPGGERETLSLDEEEEMWFEREGDDDDDSAATSSETNATSSSSTSALADLDTPACPTRHNRDDDDDDDDDDSASAKIHSSSVFESTVSSTTRNNGDSTTTTTTPLLNSTDNKVKISINIPSVVKGLNGVSPISATSSSPPPSTDDDKADDEKKQPSTKNGLIGGLVDYSDDDSDEDDSVTTTSDDKTTEQSNELKGAGDNNSTATTTAVTEKPTAAEGCGVKRTPPATESECPSEPASKKARLSEVADNTAPAAAIEASE